MRSGRLERSLTVAACLVAMTAGCGDAGRRAAIYRAEKILYEATKAETEARLGGTHPDSATALALRAKFLKVRAAAPGPYELKGTPEERELVRSTIRLVGGAEASGVRLALEARRADLALEAATKLQQEAGEDTAIARQAAFMEVAALQGLHRYDEAVVKMKAILRTYPPMPPPENGEDPVLAIPDAMVALRRNLGDEDGAQRELRDGLAYYQSLVAQNQPAALEAQVRARILRTQLELGQVGRALEEAGRLERLIEATPSLRSMLAEVTFAKGKIRAQTEKDPREGIALLDRVAIDYPSSPLAPRAMFEAGVQAEAKGLLPEARAHYESVIQRFPDAPDVPALALFRIGILQEKSGDWISAKATLESIPTMFPRSLASAEAPMAIIQHYLRDNRKTAAELYMPKALESYRSMIEADSTGRAAPFYRAKMYQLFLARKDSTGVYNLTEEMYRADPKHPYTAQMLLQSARVAQSLGNPRRGVVYLRQFLQSFPNSSLAPEAKRLLRDLGA